MSRTSELRRILAEGSRSFSLAGRLLPEATLDDAAALYAWCRRADDAVDDSPPSEQPAALARLEQELDTLYGGSVPAPSGRDVTGHDALVLEAFAELVDRRRIPRLYPAELLTGMEMDVRGTHYRTLDDLRLYAYRVASTVGLMMCHVLGVKDDAALRPAAHLGVALQFTNISRDVQEDWGLGRLYLPDSLLGAAAAPLHEALGSGPFPDDHADAAAEATQRLLQEAEAYYASADRGLESLPLQAAMAIRSARWIYRGIGVVVAEQGHDPRAGRAVVPTPRKLGLLARASGSELVRVPRRMLSSRGGRPPRAVARPEDVLPW